MSGKYSVVQATTAAQCRLVYQLRYKIFVEELRFQIPGIDPDDGVHSPTDEYAWLGLGYYGDTPVGTLTINSWKCGALSDEMVKHLQLDHFAAHFSRDAISVTHKALVTDAHRGSQVFLQMVAKGLQDTQTSESQFVFVDCAPALVHFYERLGLRRYAPHFYYDRQGILAVPMVLAMSDYEHLARIGGPLYGICRGLGIPDNPKVRAYFTEHWTLERPSERLEPDDPLLAPPHATSESFDLFQSPLFLGLTHEEIRSLIAGFGEPRPFRRKDVLITPTQKDGGVYVIVDGYVEIAIEKEGQRLSVATAGPGESLGEIGNLLDMTPTAQVVALTDGGLVRFSRDHITELFEREPRIAALLFRNMARHIAERLRVTSLWITERPPL